MITITENHHRHQRAYELLFFSNIRQELFKDTHDYYCEADFDVHLLLNGGNRSPFFAFDEDIRHLDQLIHQLEYPI